MHHLKRAHLPAAENSVSVCVGFHVYECVCEVLYVVCSSMCASVKMLTECEIAIMGIMHSP